mgnify:CR=1 FL=1
MPTSTLALLHDLLGKGNVLSLGYDSYYQHEFPLYWELRHPETKPPRAHAVLTQPDAELQREGRAIQFRIGMPQPDRREAL